MSDKGLPQKPSKDNPQGPGLSLRERVRRAGTLVLDVADDLEQVEAILQIRAVELCRILESLWGSIEGGVIPFTRMPKIHLYHFLADLERVQEGVQDLIGQCDLKRLPDDPDGEAWLVRQLATLKPEPGEEG
jgi:hypothetical protein